MLCDLMFQRGKVNPDEMFKAMIYFCVNVCPLGLCRSVRCAPVCVLWVWS